MGVGKHICTSGLCSFFDPPEGEDTLLVSDAGALDHDEVLLDLSVVGEPAHGVDGLVSQVVPERHFSLYISNSSVVKFISYGKDNVFEYQRTLLYHVELEQNFST
jgi:hypothetical protein